MELDFHRSALNNAHWKLQMNLYVMWMIDHMWVVNGKMGGSDEHMVDVDGRSSSGGSSSSSRRST